MTKLTAVQITEQLSPPPRGDYESRAANILVRLGAQFVDDANRDNPDGPVTMRTEISRTEVVYEVVVGDRMDSRGARCIWHRVVSFGESRRHCAGGAAFVEAARAQEAVAWAALDLLEARRT